MTQGDSLCGDNCKWVFDEKTKTLLIRGNGEMDNYEWKEQATTAPWYSIIKQIENVLISEGIMMIGNYASFECSPLLSITIPSSITSIGWNMFFDCSSLTAITIPCNSVNIEMNAFSSYSSLISGDIWSISLMLNKETGEMTFTGKGKNDGF